MSHDVIMVSLTHLEKAADNSSYTSPDYENDALGDEVRALKKEVTMLRRTNTGTPTHDANSITSF